MLVICFRVCLLLFFTFALRYILMRRRVSQFASLQQAFETFSASNNLPKPSVASPDDEFLQTRSGKVCHPERSEGSEALATEILRCAQDDSPGFGRGNSLSVPQGQTFVTARHFASEHNINWAQMQVWIDRKVIATTLSADDPPGFVLTPDQQSLVIAYWRSHGISFTPCERCPHYVQVIDFAADLK